MEDSFNKRYIFKLLSNLVGLAAGFLIQALIPRGLGPKAYGDFNFLTSFFTQFVNFFDMGSSIGFYTKLSQRPKEKPLVSFYFYFVGIVAVALIIFVVFAQVSSAYVFIWPKQNLLYIYLGLIWALGTWLVQIIEKMTDAYGLTVLAEKARMIQKFLGLIIILVLFTLHMLSIITLFFYHYVILAFISVASIWVMEFKGYSLQLRQKLSKNDVKAYIKEFYKYTHPLLIYGLVSMLANIFDRWLLQVANGSVQQGFYSLSLQIGTLCFLFTGAMTPLLTRELAICFSDMCRCCIPWRPIFLVLWRSRRTRSSISWEGESFRGRCWP